MTNGMIKDGFKFSMIHVVGFIGIVDTLLAGDALMMHDKLIDGLKSLHRNQDDGGEICWENT